MVDTVCYKTFDDKTVTFPNFHGRCGVIPYAITNLGEILMAFGIDRLSGDITDWGGSHKPGEYIHDAAMRELTEESNGVLKITTLPKDYLVGYSDTAVTFFAEFSYKHLMNLPKIFIPSDEMISFKLMSLKTVDKSIKEQLFYKVVSEMLSPCMQYLHLIESKLVAKRELDAIKNTGTRVNTSVANSLPTSIYTPI